MNLGAGKIAQWLTNLPCMHEDWSLDPQNPDTCWLGMELGIKLPFNPNLEQGGQ